MSGTVKESPRSTDDLLKQKKKKKDIHAYMVNEFMVLPYHTQTSNSK